MIYIHPLADVQSKNIGNDTKIWQFCVVLKGAKVGDNCNINCHVFIENDVIIGNNVTIKPGVQVWDGVRFGNNVFVGPNVTFTNDLVPRSKQHDFKLKKTNILEGASIGANSTIIAGNTIGEFSFIGAGSVVTCDIPPCTVWYGNPAMQKGYITREGIILDIKMKDKKNKQYKFSDNNFILDD